MVIASIASTIPKEIDVNDASRDSLEMLAEALPATASLLPPGLLANATITRPEDATRSDDAW